MLQLEKFTKMGNRHEVSTGEPFFPIKKLLQDGLTFMAAIEIEISRQLFDRRPNFSNLQVKQQFGQIGKTSITRVDHVFLPGSQTPLFSRKMKFVYIDRELRKPKAWPRWLVDKLQSTEMISEPPFLVAQFDKAEKTFVHRAQVLWLDTDSYNHTTYAAYPGFALNALHYAMFLKSLQENGGKDNRLQLPNRHWSGDLSALDGFSESIIHKGLESFQISYISECNEGDVVAVHVWRSDAQDFKVNVSVEHTSGSRICQMVLKYYGPNSLL